MEPSRETALFIYVSTACLIMFAVALTFSFEASAHSNAPSTDSAKGEECNPRASCSRSSW